MLLIFTTTFSIIRDKIKTIFNKRFFDKRLEQSGLKIEIKAS